jgi:hypothetical protein
MAKYLLYLLLLLGTSNAQAGCYYTQSSGGMPVYGSIFANGGDSLQFCQSLACSIWPTMSGCPNATPAPPPVTCTSTFVEKTESCEPNHSGARRSKQETKTCTDGQVTVFPWQLFSDTCVRNPPTCQTSTQTQTLSCPTGYTGSITQSQTSTCPDPYGSPIWPGAWTTNSNTCVKSVTNPTNPTSPVSPLNPASVVSSPAAAVTSTATVSTTTSSTSASPTSSDGSTAPAPASSATSAPAPTTSAKPSTTTTTTGATTRAQQIANTVRMVATLDIIEKNSIKQFDAFPIIPFGLNMPEDLIKYQAIGLELIQTGMPNIVQDVKKLKENSLEIEQ